MESQVAMGLYGGAGLKSLDVSVQSNSSERAFKVIKFNTMEPLDPTITAVMPRTVYFHTLSKYLADEQMKFFTKFKQCVEANDESAMVDFKNQAHRLKGTSGYVGAGRVHYDCFFVLEAFQKSEFEKQRALYNRLVEDMVDLHYHVSACAQT